MSDAPEKWKPIPFAPDYSASTRGRIRRDKDGKDWKAKAGRILKPIEQRSGYLVVSLYEAGRKSKVLVHRAVAVTHLGPPPFERAVVRHLNEDVLDNDVRNLAWGTATENKADSVFFGTVPAGERSGQAKLTQAQAEEVRRLRAEGTSCRAIGWLYGIHESTVRTIVRGLSYRPIGAGPLSPDLAHIRDRQLLQAATYREKHREEIRARNRARRATDGGAEYAKRRALVARRRAERITRSGSTDGDPSFLE
ncbi:MAG: HNH endonuclease [Alsobacter sp.]